MIEGMFKTELDKVYSLEELLRKTRKLFEDDRKIVEQINSFEQLVNEKRSAVMTTYSNRIEFWKKLIGKYICIKSGTDERKLYAFPYKYITGNHCVAMLQVECNSNYKSGINDEIVDIFKNFDKDVEVVEITEEEFVDMAMKRCREVLEYRKRRIEMEKNGEMPNFNVVIRD